MEEGAKQFSAILLKRFDKLESENVVLSGKVGSLMKSVASVKEIVQNMGLRKECSMPEFCKNGKKLGFDQKPIEVLEAIIQAKVTFLTVTFDNYVLRNVMTAVLFGEIIRPVPTKGNELVGMTEYFGGVYFFVKSEDTRDVLERFQGPLESKMRSRTLELLVKHSVLDNFDRFQSPGIIFQHQCILIG